MPTRMTRRGAILAVTAIAVCKCIGCNSSTPSPTVPEANAGPDIEAPMNRILFPGNPWPNGHPIKDVTWSARLDPNTGLWFDLHLESEDYNAEDRDNKVEDEETRGDWESKTVWNNYHRCVLSSTYWGHQGFLAATPARRLDFATLADRTFEFDPLPPADDVYKRAFGIYLTGHDGVADHRIRFVPQNAAGNYLLEWDGKIALEYSGSDVFEYTFRARYDHLAFAGIELPEKMTEAEGRTLLNSLVDNIGQLNAGRKDERIWLIPA